MFGNGPPSQSKNIYDFVIVGAGSAGCVLANRLSADGARVLLLEAGSRDLDPLIHIPLGVGMLQRHRMHDWGYASEPEPHLNSRRIDSARGKVLGGSSSINVMVFTRGHPVDYDRWAANGATGWSYREVLPYFKRCESWSGGANEWRGGSGPLQIRFGQSPDPLFKAWRAAGEAAGLPWCDDSNGQHPVGFARPQLTIANGRRASAAVAFLKPVMERHNLEVLTGAHTSKILFNGRRAIGVEFQRRGSLEVALAGEVIISAGAFNSPQLLQLSGIGPAGDLKSAGVKPLTDLPVGRNLQDHIAFALMFARKEPGPFQQLMRADRIALSMLRSYFLGSGPASTIPSGLQAFVKTRPELELPDIEFTFRGMASNPYAWFPGIRKPYKDTFGIRPTLLHPESQGDISLRSSDPTDAPRIRYNALSSDCDIDTLREGYKMARDLAYAPALDSFRGKELSPGSTVKSDTDIDAFIRRVAVTANHPIGTCKMGIGEDAVVDPELRVIGHDGLRVIDASVMPDLVSGHINAGVMMIAEKGADLILGKRMESAIPLAA